MPRRCHPDGSTLLTVPDASTLLGVPKQVGAESKEQRICFCFFCHKKQWMLVAAATASSKVTNTCDPCRSEAVARRLTKNLVLTGKTEEADSPASGVRWTPPES